MVSAIQTAAAVSVLADNFAAGTAELTSVETEVVGCVMAGRTRKMQRVEGFVRKGRRAIAVGLSIRFVLDKPLDYMVD